MSRSLLALAIVITLAGCGTGPSNSPLASQSPGTVGTSSQKGQTGEIPISYDEYLAAVGDESSVEEDTATQFRGAKGTALGGGKCTNYCTKFFQNKYGQQKRWGQGYATCGQAFGVCCSNIDKQTGGKTSTRPCYQGWI